MSATAPATRDLFGVPFADTIVRSANLSRCGAYRFTLTRTWSSESDHVCFIGLNPSTADHRQDDPTVRRFIHFARSWGYGGFTAVNLCPLRMSSPTECRKWAQFMHNGPDWYAPDRIHFDNLPLLVREAKAAALVVACWGAGVWDPEFVDHVLEEITTGEAPWPDVYCFGLTADGAPIHPMARARSRIPDYAKPVLWKVQERGGGSAAKRSSPVCRPFLDRSGRHPRREGRAPLAPVLFRGRSTERTIAYGLHRVAAASMSGYAVRSTSDSIFGLYVRAGPIERHGG